MKIKVKTQTIINVADHMAASEAYITDSRASWRCMDKEIVYCREHVEEIKREV